MSSDLLGDDVIDGSTGCKVTRGDTDAVETTIKHEEIRRCKRQELLELE